MGGRYLDGLDVVLEEGIDVGIGEALCAEERLFLVARR